MSSEARWTVTGELSISTVASIKAGVVSSVVTAHRNRQLGSSDREGKREETHMLSCFISDCSIRGIGGVQQVKCSRVRYLYVCKKQENQPGISCIIEFPAAPHRGEIRGLSADQDNKIKDLLKPITSRMLNHMY